MISDKQPELGSRVDEVNDTRTYFARFSLKAARTGTLYVALPLLFVYALLFVMQESLIFFPQRDGPGTSYEFGLPVEELFVAVDGAELHALHFRTADPQGVVLYLHGNAGSLHSWGAVAPDLVTHGYDLFIIDYRGYGQSSGRITSEAQLHTDMARVYDHVQTLYPEDQIVLYGRSLGTPLAARLAADNNPRLLILESPFYSLEVLARRQFPFVPGFLVKYPLRTHEWIAWVQCPVVIIHGRDDAIVPFADGERLQAHVRAPLSFYAIDGGGHNDLSLFPAYHAALAKVLR